MTGLKYKPCSICKGDINDIHTYMLLFKLQENNIDLEICYDCLLYLYTKIKNIKKNIECCYTCEKILINKNNKFQFQINDVSSIEEIYFCNNCIKENKKILNNKLLKPHFITHEFCEFELNSKVLNLLYMDPHITIDNKYNIGFFNLEYIFCQLLIEKSFDSVEWRLYNSRFGFKIINIDDKYFYTTLKKYPKIPIKDLKSIYDKLKSLIKKYENEINNYNDSLEDLT